MDSPFSEPQAGAHLHATLTWSAGAPRFVNQEIERKYRADALAHTGLANRIGIVALVTIFNLFFFTESKLSPEVITLSAWLRFAVLTPLTALFLVSDWRGWLGRWRTQGAMMIALATTLIAAAEWRHVTSTTAIPNIEAASLLQLGALGLRLSVRQTGVFVALSCMIYIAGISLSPCMSSLALPSLVLTDLAIGIAIMVFNTRVDVRDRRVFLLVLQAEEGRALLAAQNIALDRLLHMDALTGLGNRRCFDEALAAAWAHAEASRTPLGLVMFDIDHFKPFNDRLGHRAGDECLRALGAAVAACVREPGDTLARYGGEEFALILPGAMLADAAAAAERIRRAIVDLAIPHPASTQTGCLTVSLGVACAVPGIGGPGSMSVASPGALVEAADRCLYAAKRRGRNRLATDYYPASEDALASEKTA
jgi:diguanylate cyclase (GGDEF)-like protein